jgi:hypothetical protein
MITADWLVHGRADREILREQESECEAVDVCRKPTQQRHLLKVEGQVRWPRCHGRRAAEDALGRERQAKEAAGRSVLERHAEGHQ